MSIFSNGTPIKILLLHNWNFLIFICEAYAFFSLITHTQVVVLIYMRFYYIKFKKKNEKEKAQSLLLLALHHHPLSN